MKHLNAPPEHNASPCILAFRLRHLPRQAQRLHPNRRPGAREHDLEFAHSTPVIGTELRALAARARTAGAYRPQGCPISVPRHWSTIAQPSPTAWRCFWRVEKR
jgi:hypothetical protein